MHERAGTLATKSDLTDIAALTDAYFALKPDPGNPGHQVVFGTSGHRGSSLTSSFNDDHIAAITQAIVEYRSAQNITGPIFVGHDACHAMF